MAQNSSPTPAELLDDQLWQVYAPGAPANPASAAQRAQALGGTELKMLAKLFTASGFGPAIQAAASGDNKPARTRVALAWIDKRPVAAVAGQRRTEYGDMAVFRIHGFKPRTGPHSFNARCLLLQAKVASSQAQLLAPCVPVNPSQPPAGSSTERELALLSTGPLHDLYEYGASRQHLAQGLDLHHPPAPPPLPPNPVAAWYMATPRHSPPGPGTAWRSPWMCGPAQAGEACDVSLGELLASFFAGKKVRRPQDGHRHATAMAGRSFALDLADLRAGSPGNRLQVQAQHWDRVCVEILRGMRGFDMPTYLTGGQATPGLRSIRLFANPIEPLYETLLRTYEHLRRALGRSKMLVVVVSMYADD